MLLAEALTAEEIRIDLAAEEKDEVLRSLARLLAQGAQPLDESSVYDALREREECATTGVGAGVAIPHGQLPIERLRIAMAISPDGVPFDTLDGEPVHVAMAILAPTESPAVLLKAVARIARLLRDQSVCTRLRAAASAQDALDIVAEEELRH